MTKLRTIVIVIPLFVIRASCFIRQSEAADLAKHAPAKQLQPESHAHRVPPFCIGNLFM
jgi:hypothetical protein